MKEAGFEFLRLEVGDTISDELGKTILRHSLVPSCLTNHRKPSSTGRARRSRTAFDRGRRSHRPPVAPRSTPKPVVRTGRRRLTPSTSNSSQPNSLSQSTPARPRATGRRPVPRHRRAGLSITAQDAPTRGRVRYLRILYAFALGSAASCHGRGGAVLARLDASDGAGTEGVGHLGFDVVESAGRARGGSVAVDESANSPR